MQVLKTGGNGDADAMQMMHMMQLHDDATSENTHMTKTESKGEASGTSAPGCHNTPTLQEDLAPRSKNERGRG